MNGISSVDSKLELMDDEHRMQVAGRDLDHGCTYDLLIPLMYLTEQLVNKRTVL